MNMFHKTKSIFAAALLCLGLTAQAAPPDYPLPQGKVYSMGQLAPMPLNLPEWVPPTNQAYSYAGQGITLSLACATPISCAVTTAIEGTPTAVDRFAVEPPEDLSGLVRAWTYVRTNIDKPTARAGDPMLAQAREALRTHFAEPHNLMACSGLVARGQEFYEVCSIANNPDAVMLFMPLMSQCTNGFCGYAALPLIKMKQ